MFAPIPLSTPRRAPGISRICSELMRERGHPWWIPDFVGMTVLWLSKSRQGGAVAARPVHPEWPDASSGCIEGPAQLNVWGGADANYSRQDFERPPSLNTCTRPREWTPQYICATLAADKLDATRRVLASYLLSLEAENRRASEARANHLNHQITRITVQTFPVNVGWDTGVPSLSRPVPRQIRTVGHHLSHFSEKCPISQIGMRHFGTEWDTSQENRPLHAAPRRSRTPVAAEMTAMRGSAAPGNEGRGVPPPVVPVKTGTHPLSHPWIPAFAGMTVLQESPCAGTTVLQLSTIHYPTTPPR